MTDLIGTVGSANDLGELFAKVFEGKLRPEDMGSLRAALLNADPRAAAGEVVDFMRRLSVLIEILDEVSASHSLDALLPRVITTVAEALDADRGTLFLYDRGTDELFSRVARGDLVNEIRMPKGRGIAGSVFTTGQAVIIDDAYQDKRFNPEVDRQTGYRTRNILCVPLRNKSGSMIGVTQVLNKRAGAFTEGDRMLLEALTTQASAALEQAQLIEEVERARREEIELLEAASAISSSLELDQILAKIMSASCRLLDADRSTLFLHDSKTNELWSRFAEGMEQKEIRFPAGAGIAGSAFTSGKTVVIADCYQDSRFNPEIDRKTGYRTRNMLCTPVMNKSGQRIGAIQVLNKRGDGFGPADERRLQALCAQAVAAIENAQLFEDVLNIKNYNESILKSLSNGVISFDQNHRIIKVNPAAARILNAEQEALLERTAEEGMGLANAWILESLARVEETGAPALVLDTDFTRHDGEAIAVNSTTVPLINVKGEPIGAMLVAEDISREKRVRGAMSRFMSKAIVDRLLEQGEGALAGRLLEATVLFSDIRKFTTLTEALGPAETVSMLNEYFTLMVDVIFASGGILDKYIGDAILATFGPPFETDGNADVAMEVANEMMRALNRFNVQRVEQRLSPLEIGIGLSTGQVLAGSIGSPKRMDYTVIGDTVNLASRLESATKQYGVRILVSEFTVARLKSDCVLRELDLIKVKGKENPVGVFEALDFCFDGSCMDQRRTLGSFATGIKRYRARDFQGALSAFADALDATPADVPSQVYIQRCKDYLAEAPSDDWDGVWVMHEK